MSFINLIESQEGRFTLQCQDYRFVGYLFLLGSFFILLPCWHIYLLWLDFAVNYHSVS
jgi:hypothetical protein